jgi:hypothetical protein
MVSDDNGAHNLSMEPTICHGPQKKKTSTLKVWPSCSFLFHLLKLLHFFLFFLGGGGRVLWVNGFSFALSSETRKWVYWCSSHLLYRWISGPYYVCVIYAFNSILDCNLRFMGFHIHKSQEIFFFLQFCDIKHVAKDFMKVWQNFPLTKLANWLVHIKCKNGPLYSHKSIFNVFQIKQWDGQGVGIQDSLQWASWFVPYSLFRNVGIYT